MKKVTDNTHTYARVATAEFDEDDGVCDGPLSVQQRINSQNSNLDLLEKSVFRLGEISLTISHEIDAQNKSLSSLEAEVETAHDNIDNVTKRTKEFVKEAGGCEMLCVIVGLIVVVIVLALLLIYT